MAAVSETSVSRISDDLMLSIFLDNDFTHPDLSRLCLVWKRFFPSVQRSLYRRIIVTSIYSSTSEILNTGWTKVTRGSLILVGVLERNRELAKLVKTIEFRGVEAMKSGREAESGEEPPRHGVLTRILELAENCEGVKFGKGYEMLSPVRDLLHDFRHRVLHLSLAHCYQKDLHYLAESFPHLRRLEIDYLSLHPTVPLPSSTAFDLGELFIGGDAGSESLVEFIMDSSSTLRKLSLPQKTALKLDYSKFTKLTNLQLVESSGSLIEPLPTSFWFNLARCTSLENLALPGSTSQIPEEEEATFSLLSDDEISCTAFPNLRTLRFTTDFSLDRIADFLSCPLSNKLKRILVSYCPSSQGREGQEGRRRLQKFEMLKGYCEKVGIQVCLEEE
ncbi:hypothetical protein JCM3765_004328 [Sporobolomyces pararoseus]